MPTRRPRRSATQWAEIITHYRQSNLNARLYCEQHDYSLATLRKWQTRFSGHEANDDSPSPGRLVELIAAKSTDPPSSHTLLIELTLGSGMHLKIRR